MLMLHFEKVESHTTIRLPDVERETGTVSYRKLRSALRMSDHRTHQSLALAASDEGPGQYLVARKPVGGSGFRCFTCPSLDL
jgi:hypothetical protein